MKFQHLPIGAPFEFEGKHYTKTSPLVAAEEGGGQRLIPRFAVLRTLPGSAAMGYKTLTLSAEVEVAFAAFEQTASQLLQRAQGASDAQQVALQTALTAAAQRFRSKIESDVAPT